MEIIIYIAAAVFGYFAGSVNPAIMLSKAVYHKDIREYGSKNPGFTNFKRTFGGRLAWLVMVLDLSKAAVVTVLFSLIFGKYFGNCDFGAAYTGFFCMLGHAFPLQYKLKGGKGFLVCLSTLFVLDIRVGIIATLIMCALLLTTKYMSLSTVSAMLVSPILLLVMGCDKAATLVFLACTVFMAVRHKENIKRLINGTESKFTLGTH